MLSSISAAAPPQTPLRRLQRSPDLPAGFGWRSRQGRSWAGVEEGKGEVGERGAPKVTVEPGPLRALLYTPLLTHLL